MSPPTKTNEPGSSTSQARPDVDATTNATNTPIVATGRLLPPNGRRSPHWLLTIDRCPICSRRHTHGAPAGPDTTEIRRLSHCQNGGKPYVVRVAA
ncbi:hypothetical protein [Nonomuraea angiospora]|uniref:hypothetical protein n=1 Tax=Nonomuraea angiospora TaxID=46172 RepID=UPI0029B47A9B|nr:hypothetical protein [Nonomuraea angiospora]MDX3099702.1 hypothetical protein [Nonomuraea angiospora]